MRLITLILLMVGTTLLATPRCEFGELTPAGERYLGLVRLLAEEKGQLENDSLLAIVEAPGPINPMDGDDSFRPTQRHAYETAFDKQIKQGISPEDWELIRADAARILTVRTGQAIQRHEVETSTDFIVAPLDVASATLRGVPLILPNAPNRTVRGTTDHSPVFSYEVDNDGMLTLKYQDVGGKNSKGAWHFARIDPSNGSAREIGRRISKGRYNSEVGLIRDAQGRLLSVTYYYADAHGTPDTAHVSVHDVESGREVSRFRTSRFDPHHDEMMAYLRADGSIAVLFLGRDDRGWQIDSVRQKFFRAPYKGRAVRYQRPSEGQRAFALAVVKTGIPFLSRKLRFAVSDLSTGREIFSAPLDVPVSEVPDRNTPPNMVVREKPDGSILAAVRHGDKVYVFDSATGKRYTLDAPFSGNVPFVGFTRTPKGWLFATEPGTPAIVTLNVDTGAETRFELSAGNYSNVSTAVAKDGTPYLFADRRATNESPQLIALNLSRGEISYLQAPLGGAREPLAAYRDSEGRLIRLYQQGETFKLIQLLGPGGR